MSPKVKMEIMDTIQMYSATHSTYRKLWQTIKRFGIDSDAVNNWLVQFENCNDAMDFLLQYEN